MKGKKQTSKKSSKIITPKKKEKPVKVKAVSKPAPKKDDVVRSRVMTCIVTGIERRVSKAGIIKGMKKFGNMFAFEEHYVSNEAKRLLKQRVSPEETQKQLRPSNKQPFSIDKQVLARLKLLKKPKNAKRITEEEAREIAVKWVPKEPRTYASVKEYVIANTQNGSCIAPQLFLDSDRVCDVCKYREDCLSTIKQFSKKYKN